NDAASTLRFGDSGFSHGKRRMDSRYQRGSLGKDQCVARRACVVGRERISNLAANGAPVSRVNHRDCNSRVLGPRLERNARFCCSQAIVSSVGRFGVWPDCARCLGDLEQQSGRYRHRACRVWRGNAIFWCEHQRDLLANFTKGNCPGAAAECAETDAGMKTAIVDNPTVASSRPNFVSDLAELVKARLTLLVLLTTAVGFYLGAEPPINYKALFQTVFGTAAAAAG